MASSATACDEMARSTVVDDPGALGCHELPISISIALWLSAFRTLPDKPEFAKVARTSARPTGAGEDEAMSPSRGNCTRTRSCNRHDYGEQHSIDNRPPSLNTQTLPTRMQWVRWALRAAPFWTKGVNKNKMGT